EEDGGPDGAHQESDIPPHGDEPGLERPLGLGLGGRGGVLEELVDALGEPRGLAGVLELDHEPARLRSTAATLVEVLVVKVELQVRNAGVARRVDPTNGEGPVAGKNGALERDRLPQPPAEFLHE